MDPSKKVSKDELLHYCCPEGNSICRLFDRLPVVSDMDPIRFDSCVMTVFY